MTPEREAQIRRWVAEARPLSVQAERDLLAALDAEREARQRAERERDEARTEVETLEEDVREHLPEYELLDGTGDEANVRERIEIAGLDIAGLTRERDEARALPVIRTCGGCGWCQITAVRQQIYECEHPRVTDAGIPLSVDLKRAPPEWCPLRGGLR